MKNFNAFNELDLRVDKSEMTKAEVRKFVEDAFKAYEKEGFAKVYWTPFDFHTEKIGKSFEIIGRIIADNFNLNDLPMWNIIFTDGTFFEAYP